MPPIFYGAASGQLTVTTNAQPLINGLTVCKIIQVFNSTASKSIAYIYQPLGSVATGYTLEPGMSVVVDTNNNVNTWNVSTDGTTCRVSWIARQSE